MTLSRRISEGIKKSALGREINPSNRTNLYIVIVALVVGVATAISHGWDSGLRGSVAVFVGWALVRELAPDRSIAAYLAPVPIIAYAIPAQSNIAACFGLLLATRLVNHSTGNRPKVVESIFVLSLAIWLSLSVESVAIAIILAGLIFTTKSRLRTVLTVVAVVSVIVTAALEGSLDAQGLSLPSENIDMLALVVVAAAILASVVVRAPRYLSVPNDRGTSFIRGDQVRAARIIVLFALLASMIWAGPKAMYVLSCASGAAVAVAVAGLTYRTSGESDTVSS